MKKIIVTKLTTEQIADKNITSWPIWKKETSVFPWHYDDTEHCLILEGKVTVTFENDEITFGAGDYVTFPKGLSCIWKIHEPVKKHYCFE